jgi:L-seryl-tRNA(Ser) seleniumtransferase
VDEALRDPHLALLLDEHGRGAVTDALRSVLVAWRELIILRGDMDAVATAQPAPSALAEAVSAALQARAAPSLRSALNATGIILHTGLGHAVLPLAAVQAVEELARRLRSGDSPVYPRVQHDAVLLDFRTVFPEEDAQLIRRLREAL